MSNITTNRRLPKSAPEGLIQQLVHATEGQFLERTGPKIAARELGDVIAGFANADGGRIVIGIQKGTEGKVIGIGQESERRINAWRQASAQFVDPPATLRFELIGCTNVKGEPDSLAILDVESSTKVHRNVKGDVYLRIGDSTRKLTAAEAQELLYDKGESAFDGSPVGEAGTSSLDDRAVARFVRAIHARGSSTNALKARGLAVEQDGELQATVAGLLVLGEAPQLAFPEASVRVLRYQGPSRETGSRANVLADRRIDGSLVKQVRGAARLLRRWIPEAVRLGPDARFAPEALIPEPAWLEAIVNAVVHRSYSMGGDHIRVELFDDRLEVHSPGRLPGLVRPENIRESRFARNPRIARAVSDLGYGRELGEGVNRMFEEMSRVGLPDPVYVQTASSVRVTLLADPLARRILERLPRGSERFVEFASRMGQFTTVEAADLLGLSRPTVRRHLYDLAEANLIEHIGTSPKDPRGYWRVKR
ncbi:MAG: putative DNA binding domain-containing protein [Chloroflexota bacterium]|nr:putative DNA binding domain-containing protein [Chloroflexota bacterium]